LTETEATYRLPRAVTPSRYDLTLRPDLDAGTFAGHEDVTVTVHELTTEIVLNAKELSIDGGSLRAGDRTVGIDKVVLDADTERAILALAEPIEPGEWVLSLAFAGTLNDRMTGFYRSTFEDEDGRQRVIATTHFEATDARMCIPSWDEPDLKAVFGVTLEVREGLTALSNGPETGREDLGDGWVRVSFAPTMKMSTYLLCVVVGPLVLTPERDARGVPVRVACRPGREHLAGFALDVAVHSLNWFGDYYAIPYPDAKLDNVGVPDFAQGAMENLGLVTYRETLLLIDRDEATHEDELDLAETVAHEIAHMWFGDLVTMRWWNGIWLNEAFATFMSYLCVNDLYPEWRVFDSFFRIRANAFETDQLASTRPIEYPVLSPNDASGMFDTLTYTKGGAVLRMLEQWLGADRFRDGIRRYLSTHAYGNTETHHLWDALEEETGEPVRRIMDAWIFQPGYPAVTVRREGDRIRLTQRRYVPSDPDDATTWPIPLTVRQVTAEQEHLDRVLVEADGLTLPLAAPDAVVVANLNGSSFVRVFYDDELRERIVAAAHVALSAGERVQLVDDAWASVVAGETSIGSFLDLAAGFTDEDDPSVWGLLITGLTWADRFVEGSAREAFRDEVRSLVRPALARLGWERRDDDDAQSSELRGQLIRALGILGDDPETQAQAREVEAEARGGEVGDADVAAAAVDVVAASGSEDEFERFRAWMREAPTPQAQARYREALTRFRDPVLMDRLLAATLTDEIRPQDAPFLLAYAQRNRDLGPAAFRFVAAHWGELTAKIAQSNVIALPAGARLLTAPDDVEAVQAFFAEHDIPQNHLMLQQMLERQRVYAALRRRAEPELAARFGG
jgi:puromycin-sensitive aminopeptidase